jgi:hypothetical protein
MSTTNTQFTEPPPLLNTETGRATSRILFPNAIPIKPLEFDRSGILTHEPEVIAKAMDALRNEYPSFSNTSNWLYSKDDWQTYERRTNQACHASLTSMEQKAYDTVIATENGLNRLVLKPKKDNYKPFLSWLLYDSPYGEFILNREDFDFCLDYGFVISGGLPQPLLMNICILSRHFYEIPVDSFKAFNKLTSDGIDPTVCYSMLMNRYGVDDTGIWQSYGGHRAAPAYSPVVLKNIYNGVYGKDVERRTMKDIKSIYGASKLFDNNQYNAFTHWAQDDEDFRKALKESRGVPVETYRPPNPFVKNLNADSAIRPGQFTNKECVDFVIPYLDKLIRKEMSGVT